MRGTPTHGLRVRASTAGDGVPVAPGGVGGSPECLHVPACVRVACGEGLALVHHPARVACHRASALPLPPHAPLALAYNPDGDEPHEEQGGYAAAHPRPSCK